MQAFRLDKAASLTPTEPLGFSHHGSLEKLATSADKCGLCGLICSSISAFVASYVKSEDDEVFLHDQHHYLGLPSDFQLWLTNRLNSRDSFLVFVYARSEHCIYLVTAASFCVENGMPQFLQSKMSHELKFYTDLDSLLASRYQGRPVTEDGGRAIALDRVAALMQNSVDHHVHCTPSSSPLPSRLLDLEGCKDRKE
jgi:hypothetical protein